MKKIKKMDILQRQANRLYFQHLGELIMKWYDSKPKNKDLKQAMNCTSKIGMYINMLEMENDINIQRIQKMRENVLKYKLELDELLEIKNKNNER